MIVGAGAAGYSKFASATCTGRDDIQHKDTQHNDTHHNGVICDTQHK